MNTRVHRRRTLRTAVATVGFALICAPADPDLLPGRSTFAADDDFVRSEVKDSVGFSRKGIQNARVDLRVAGPFYKNMRLAIEARMEKRVREIARGYQLTKAEYEVVVLASHAERIRLDREIAELSALYEKDADGLIAFNFEVQSKFNELAQSNPNSFFEKKMRTFLADKIRVPRVGDHRVHSPELLRSRHRADVEAAVREVERTVELRQPQRLALIELLSKETQPAKVLGDFDDLLVKYRLAQLPKSKLEPLFDKDQWQKVRVVLDGFQEFGPILNRHGLPANEVVAVKPANLQGTVSDEFKPRRRAAKIDDE